MAALRSKGTIVVLIAVVVAITILGFCIRRQLAIDDCLDRGGRWDYAVNKCDE